MSDLADRIAQMIVELRCEESTIKAGLSTLQTRCEILQQDLARVRSICERLEAEVWRLRDEEDR